jgi:hypothetical protein
VGGREGEGGDLEFFFPVVFDFCFLYFLRGLDANLFLLCCCDVDGKWERRRRAVLAERNTFGRFDVEG